MDELESLRQNMVKAFQAYNEAPHHNRSFLWTDYLELREAYLKLFSVMNKTHYQELRYQLLSMIDETQS